MFICEESVIFALWSAFCGPFLCRACTQGCSLRRSFVHWALWLRLWWMRCWFSWTAASSSRTWISSKVSATATARWTLWLVSCKNLLPSGNDTTYNWNYISWNWILYALIQQWTFEPHGSINMPLHILGAFLMTPKKTIHSLLKIWSVIRVNT